MIEEIGTSWSKTLRGLNLNPERSLRDSLGNWGGTAIKTRPFLYCM